MTTVIGFDIEIATVVPDASELRKQLDEARAAGAPEHELVELEESVDRASNWDNFRPLGISCAATYITNPPGEIEPVTVWHGDDCGDISGKMSVDQCRLLLTYLYNNSMSVVTWNGAGFDFKILAEECQGDDGLGLEFFKMAKKLTLNHVDIMFDFFCHHGYAVGLDAACMGAGIGGKTKGMSGAKAPAMWAMGREEKNMVLEYVAQDARITADLYVELLKKKRLDWTSRRGNPCSWNFDRLRTVREALERPLPESPRWIDKPWTREKFVGWMREIPKGSAGSLIDLQHELQW